MHLPLHLPLPFPPANPHLHFSLTKHSTYLSLLPFPYLTNIMSHVRKNSGCLPPDPKRLKLYESFQGAIQTEEINKSDLAKQYKSLNAAKNVNWAQGLDLLHTISDIESVYQTDAISDLGSVNMVGPIPAEGANQAEGIADLQGEFEMIDLDEALRPIDEFESSADVETGWEFIQQVLSQQKAVQEEIIPEQTGDFYSGPLFAPRPVYVPYKLVSQFQISHFRAEISSQQPSRGPQV